jgi:hypothetical protein
MPAGEACVRRSPKAESPAEYSGTSRTPSGGTLPSPIMLSSLLLPVLSYGVPVLQSS